MNKLHTIEEICQMTGMNQFQICRALPEDVVLNHRFKIEKNHLEAERIRRANEITDWNNQKVHLTKETEYLELICRRAVARKTIEDVHEYTMQRQQREMGKVMQMVSTRPEGITDEQWKYYEQILKATLDEGYKEIYQRNDRPAVSQPDPPKKRGWRRFFSWQRPQNPPERIINPKLPTAPPPEGPVNIHPRGSDVEQKLKTDIPPDQQEDRQEDAIHNGQSTGEAVQGDNHPHVSEDAASLDETVTREDISADGKV